MKFQINVMIDLVYYCVNTPQYLHKYIMLITKNTFR